MKNLIRCYAAIIILQCGAISSAPADRETPTYVVDLTTYEDKDGGVNPVSLSDLERKLKLLEAVQNEPSVVLVGNTDTTFKAVVKISQLCFELNVKIAGIELKELKSP